MTVYKVVECLRNKITGEEIDSTCNFRWTNNNKQLESNIDSVNRRKECIYGFYEYRNPAYKIIEKETCGFVLEGVSNVIEDYESSDLMIGNESLLYKMLEEFQGINVKVTVEILE